MVQHQEILSLQTTGRRLHDVTTSIAEIVERSHVELGVCHLLLLHTSAGLVLQENADSTVQRDLEHFFVRLAPDSTSRYEHSAEGPDDMPSHIRSVLSNVSLTVPVSQRRLVLGTWQGIYVWEHRIMPHERRIVVHVHGE